MIKHYRTVESKFWAFFEKPKMLDCLFWWTMCYAMWQGSTWRYVWG